MPIYQPIAQVDKSPLKLLVTSLSQNCLPTRGSAAPCSKGDWGPAVLTSAVMVSVMVTLSGLVADEDSHSRERCSVTPCSSIPWGWSGLATNCRPQALSTSLTRVTARVFVSSSSRWEEVTVQRALIKRTAVPVQSVSQADSQSVRQSILNMTWVINNVWVSYDKERG